MTYNTPIPPQIMTPDTVETRLGTLNFVDGVPTAATTQLVYDNLDFMRGTEVFLNFVPACSIEAIRLSFVARGAGKSNQVVHLRRPVRFQPAAADGQHRHRLLHRPAGPGGGRAHRRRNPAQLRSRHGERRFLPLRRRHGRARAGPGRRRQVPDRARLVRGRAAQGQDGRRRLFRRPFAVAKSTS